MLFKFVSVVCIIGRSVVYLDEIKIFNVRNLIDFFKSFIFLLIVVKVEGVV